MKTNYNHLQKEGSRPRSIAKALRGVVLICFCTLSTMVLHAQSITVSGFVSSDSGEPLIGATVVVPNSSKNALTDFDGSYHITVDTGDELLVQYVGYAPQSVIANRANIDIVLAEELNELDELVVVAYGTQKKRDVIGSVATVKSDDLVGGNGGDFLSALQGSAAGLQVMGSNISGGTPDIKIRGVSSISSDVDPLWVIDGMIGGQDDVNMNDIESIEILKDASATAVYGSRGSNGVIIVTTKKGKKGEPRVNVDYKAGFTPILNSDIGYANGSDALVMFDIAAQNAGFSYFDTETYYAVTSVSKSLTRDVADVTNVDKMDLATKTGSFHDANISITHGGDYTTNYTSLNYRNDDFSLTGKDRQTIRVRTNTNYQKGNLTIGIQASGKYSETNDLSDYSNIMSRQPFEPVYDDTDPSGWWNPDEPNSSKTANDNPLVNMDSELNQDQTLALSLRANLFLDYKFACVDGLSLRMDGGYNYSFSQNNLWRALAYTYDPDAGVMASRSKTTGFGQQYHAFFTYNKEIGNHAFTVMAGGEYNESYTDYLLLDGENVVGYYPEMESVGTYLTSSVGYISSENVTLSMFTRFDYKFRDKYLFGASFSREGTAKFSADNRWGNFYSASAGWIISEEEFLKDIDWMELIKLRASFGETGNQNIPTAATQTVFGSKSTQGYNDYSTYYYDSIGNTDTKWEKTQSIDAGVDYAFFNNKLNGSVAYYRQNVSDMLLAVNLPASAGVSSGEMWNNVGDMYNQGVELSVSYNVFNTKKFNWTTSFNITSNRNKVTALNPEMDSTGSGIEDGRCITKTGYAIGTYYMPVFAGINPENGYLQIYETETDSETGEVTLTDNKLDVDSYTVSANNMMVLEDKQAFPTYFGSWNNNFRYKQFDLGISLYFSGGNYIYNATKIGIVGNQGSMMLKSSWLESSWQGVGDDRATTPILTTTGMGTDEGTGFSHGLEKGDYLRLRDLTIGYSLPEHISKRLNLSKFRVYLSMSNIATWTKFTGYDPEVTINQTSGASFSQTSQPNTAVYTLGVNLGF